MAKEELKIEFTLTDDSLKRLFSAFEEWRENKIKKATEQAQKTIDEHVRNKGGVAGYEMKTGSIKIIDGKPTAVYDDDDDDNQKLGILH